METPAKNPTIFNGPGEYIIRKGDADIIKHQKSITISGTLGAPSAFLRGKRVEDITCHLRIQKDRGILELHIQDTDPHTEHVITGSLKRDSVLESFQLNTEKRWTVREFLKFIRERKFYFSDPAHHFKMIESLRKWEGEIQTILKEHQDTQGNSLTMLEKKVTGVKFVDNFNLTIPIFQGYPKETFTVEIGLDPTSTAVNIFLISDQLFELEANKREAILEKELKEFDDHLFSKVVIS